MTDNPLDDFSDNQTNSMSNPTGITSPPHFSTKHPNSLHMTKLKLFPKRKQFHLPKTNHRTSTLHSSSVQPQFYLITQKSIQLQMTLTALSKCIPKQISLFLHHLLNLKSFCFHLSYRTFACQIHLPFLT